MKEISQTTNLNEENFLYFKREFGFGKEYDLQYRLTPSSTYFWYRKSLEIYDLFNNNMNNFLKNYSSDEKSKITFVDLGCGLGYDLFLIKSIFEKKNIECNYIGLEGNLEHLNICKLRKKYNSADNVNLILTDISSSLPLSENQADIVFCSEVIEHIPNYKEFLQEIKRILKPNGYLLITTPNEPNIFQKIFWSKEKRKQLNESISVLKKNPLVCYINNHAVNVYGHVSCKTIHEWDSTLNELNFDLVDFRRGAVVYGGSRIYDKTAILSLIMILETILDLLPKKLVRILSFQLIGLYRLNN